MGSSPGPPQDFLSLVVNGGPPYSPGAVPVDHFSGFFLGKIILVGLVLDIGLVVVLPKSSAADIDLLMDTQQYTEAAIVVSSPQQTANLTRYYDVYTGLSLSWLHKISCVCGWT